ncbi:MAG: TrmB family transcriptional regulator [Promethearchaeota archaeon]|jgi:sugar-specific transcriptional regulator TrmB
MSEKEENEIEEALQLLGFIAKHSSVDRARVYDSLNRLIEKGFIQKEPIKRGANYQVIPVKKIFKTIRDEYKQKIEDAMVLEKVISDLEINKEESEPRVWAISTRSKIRKKIKDLINAAQERIFFIITPDLLMDELGGFEWILRELWNRKFSSEIEVVIALKYYDALNEEIKKLLKVSVTIHSIDGDNVIPFGLLIADNQFLLTTLDQVKEAPEYTSGLWLENGTPKQIIGYEHLFRYFITNQCKTIKLTSKKAPYATEVL